MRISKLLPALLVMFAAFAAVSFIACSDKKGEDEVVRTITGTWYFKGKDACCLINFFENENAGVKGYIRLEGRDYNISWETNGNNLTITPLINCDEFQEFPTVCEEGISQCCLNPNDTPIGCTIYETATPEVKSELARKFDVCIKYSGVHTFEISKDGQTLKFGGFELGR